MFRHQKNEDAVLFTPLICSMKKYFLAVFIFCCANKSFCQAWTEEQLNEADAGGIADWLSQPEKEAIKYINLCRLYPAEFAEKEVKFYAGIPRLKDKNFIRYKASLMKDLKKRKPCPALELEEALYDDAECYAEEISTNKRKAHQRIDCEKKNYAECLYFGSGEGRHIALQWLIDSGIANLGHRKICLNPTYTMTGIKAGPHYEYGNCAVGEFK